MKKKKPSPKRKAPKKQTAKRKDNPLDREREFMEERSASLRGKATPNKPENDEGSHAADRLKQFFQERLAPLVAKSKKPVAPLALALDEISNIGDDLAPGLANRRIEYLKYYRERQTQKRNLIRPAMDALRPEAPQPPPGNNWVPIGPSVTRQGQGGVKPATSGRTPALAIVSGGNTVFAGAANGGIWRSDDAGNSWRSLMDAFDLNPTTAASDSLSVGAIGLDLANPNRLYVGSGEGAGAAFFGVGPIVTDNALSNAPTWVTEQAAAGSNSLVGTAFYSLAVDPADSNRVVAATYRGVYRRELNGTTGTYHWSQKSVGGVTNQRITSVVVAAAGGTTTYYCARLNGPVYSSNDGHTWVTAGSGFPANPSRITLAVQRDNPNIVYALIENGSVHRLDVSDGTWRQVTGVPADLLGSQGWYDQAIEIAPDNINRIYLGGAIVFSGGDWSASLYRCEVTVAGTNCSMTSTYIGNAVHADVHKIIFAPGDASKLWVGCDGGVFYSTNPLGTGDIFITRNVGLQTLTMEYLGQHPTEDSVLFCGTQDNGGQRFTGEEAWLYSSGGDAGYPIVNWHDPYQILITYVGSSIQRSTNGGTRYSYSNVSVTLPSGDGSLFYAPIAGTPYNPTSLTPAADANLVAFGSFRPWISTTFGGGWQSIPNNNATDNLDGAIKCLTFASPARLYAGTMAGGVYRLDRTGATWSRTQIDTIGGVNSLPLSGPVTDIAVDPSNDSRVYISFGGSGDWRHVWYFDGTQWSARSGPSSGHANSILDVQANALVIDSANPAHLYLGADIGVWRSTDGGNNWSVFSEGLPDSAVVDLLIHNQKRVLRAATHGRSVWERTLPETTKAGIECYVRSTQLDQGRSSVVSNLPDPTAQGEVVKIWRGPDIKVDTPDSSGQYQFPLTGTINFLQFVDTLTDDFRNVATHATANLTTRVYVQVHNRGVLPANNVRVMLLLANASAGLPSLPLGYEVNVRSGIPISTANWQTVGFYNLDDLRVGYPKIAAFNLYSSMLPPPANLPGNSHQCLLAIIHHADDQFTNTQTDVNQMTAADRKAAHKNLTVVQFTGTLPAPRPMAIPLRFHNPFGWKLRTNYIINTNKFPGKIRLLVPRIKTETEFNKAFKGMSVVKPTKDIDQWAKQQLKLITASQKSKNPYNKTWAKQRVEDVKVAIDSKIVLELKKEQQASIQKVVMPANSYHTVFLLVDRPSKAKTGQAFNIDVIQTNADNNEWMGGINTRVEIVPSPKK